MSEANSHDYDLLNVPIKGKKVKKKERSKEAKKGRKGIYLYL